MKLTKNQQIKNLKKILGSDSDLIDLDAHVDGRLTYDENKRIILRRAIVIKKRNPKVTFKGSPVYYYDKAEQIHAQRSPRSKAIDSRQTAQKTFNFKTLSKEQFLKWKRNPNRYDIIGIDSKGSYSKKPKLKKLNLSDIPKFDADLF